jgi:hypothetical protein
MVCKKILAKRVVEGYISEEIVEETLAAYISAFFEAQREKKMAIEARELVELDNKLLIAEINGLRNQLRLNPVPGANLRKVEKRLSVVPDS